jgi:hypothetical protein
MKIKIGQIENKFKKVYILGSRPVQDWPRIISVCALIIFGIFIWSYFFYFSVQDEFRTDFDSTSQMTPVKDKEAEIKDVVDKYKAKEVIFNTGD